MSYKQGDEVQADALATWLLEAAAKRFFIIMGLPACGKSTLSERLEKLGAVRVNRDLIRKRLYGDEGTIGNQKDVNREFYKELRAAFETGKPVISDNVNVTFLHRKAALKNAHDAEYTDIVCVFVDVPLDVCLERNRNRARKSDESVMRSMHADMVADGLPSEWEGKLVVLNNGKDAEHYKIDMVREKDGEPPADAFVYKDLPAKGGKDKPNQKEPPVTDPNVGAKRLQLGADLQTQVTLYDLCLKAGRDQWAAETLALISKLGGDGAQLFGATAAAAAPAATAARAPFKKKPWVPPPIPEATATLMKMIGHRPEVAGDGPLVALCFNGHLLDKEKAEHMIEPLLALVKRAHIVFFQESNVDALRLIARAARYGLNASHRNVREQANGMLYHPRLQWLGGQPIYHDYLLDVPGHPEYKDSLRPGLQQRLKDKATGFIFDAIDLHGKSNLGGPEATAPTRRWGFEALVKELAKQMEKSPYSERPTVSALSDYSGWDLPLGPVLVGGDYNCPIDNPATTEIEPMIQAGFARVSAPDNAWSYRFGTKGGQFDGFFIRGLQEYLTECFIPAFFPKENKKDAAFYREVSDHMPVFATFNLPNRLPVPVQGSPVAA